MVAPVYDEQELIEAFVARAPAAVADYPFELVLVNDGASDRTPELLDRIAAPTRVCGWSTSPATSATRPR